MKRGFTLIEVLLATIILGASTAGILVSLANSQRMMRLVPELEAAQEVMDLGEMAYPLEAVTDEDDIDTGEIRVSRLWELLTDERMTDEQEEKWEGYTWERKLLDENLSEDEDKQFGGLRRVRITVIWGDRGQGRGKRREESYIVLWRKSE